MARDFNRYKQIDLKAMRSQNQKTYATPGWNAIHFWPAKLNTKMDATYSYNLYTLITDYHDMLNKDYFFETDTNNNIVPPTVPYCNVTTDGKFNKNIQITLDYETYRQIYNAYLPGFDNVGNNDENNTKEDPNFGFDLRKVNYFISDWNAINPRIPFSYWFVEDVNFLFDQKTKNVGKVTFNLVLDCYSVFYNYFWYYQGDLQIKRLHNPRWIEDNIYTTGLYIPDFSTQRFIRNCDIYCSQFTEKIQVTRTVPLISSRHWNAALEEPIDSRFLKWNNKTPDAKVKQKKTIVFFVCMRIDQFDSIRKPSADIDPDKLYSYYQGEITNIGGYSEPLRYFAYVPSGDQYFPDQNEIREIINLINIDGVKTDEPGEDTKNQKYRIISSIFTEDIFESDLFVEINGGKVPKGTLFKMPDGILNYYQNENRREFYWFIEPKTPTLLPNGQPDTNFQQPYLFPKMFKTRDDLVNVKRLDVTNYDVEPHLFTSQHFTTSLAIFNKNAVEFDISTLLINNNPGFIRAEVVQKLGGQYFNYRLMMREGLISSNMIDIKYFLLDQDTSVAYKRDNGLLTISIVGTYIWPWYDNTWNEFIHNNQNQRQTAIENIQQSYKASKLSANLNFASSVVNGILSGAAGGNTVGRKDAGLKGSALWKPTIAGAGFGLIGAGISSGLSFAGQLNQIETEKANSLRTVNAQYNDAKNQAGNYNVGSALTTQADMLFSAYLIDDLDPHNYNSLWTPKITFQQLKDYDCLTVASYLNKMGYAQNNFLQVNTLKDIAYRKYWNRWEISNADEFFRKDNINPVYWVDIASALIKENGACFFNADTLKWDQIFDWSLHNIEVSFDAFLTALEGKIYG